MATRLVGLPAGYRVRTRLERSTHLDVREHRLRGQMSKAQNRKDYESYDKDRFFANTDELKAFIAEQGKRIGWNYDTCVWMAHHSDEMDYPELRVDIKKCVWLLEYAEQLQSDTTGELGSMTLTDAESAFTYT